MTNSEKLSIAALEIKAIIDKWDLAAVVVLHAPGYHEYIIKLDPTYSCATIEDGRIKMELSSTGPDQNKKLVIAKHTSNMLMHLSKRTGEIAMNLLDASMMLDKKFGAEHGNFEYPKEYNL